MVYLVLILLTHLHLTYTKLSFGILVFIAIGAYCNFFKPTYLFIDTRKSLFTSESYYSSEEGEWRQHNVGDIPVCTLGAIWLRWAAIWPDLWRTASLKQQQLMCYHEPMLQIRVCASTFIDSSISSSLKDALSSEEWIRETLEIRDRGLISADIPTFFCSNCRKPRETPNRIADGQWNLPTDKVNHVTQ